MREMWIYEWYNFDNSSIARVTSLGGGKRSEASKREQAGMVEKFWIQENLRGQGISPYRGVTKEVNKGLGYILGMENKVE